MSNATHGGGERLSASRGGERESSDRTDRPAVGLVTRPYDGAEIERAVVRADEHGYDAIVAWGFHPEPERVNEIRRQGAYVIPPDRRGGSRNPWGRLVSAAREGGYPGLLRHDAPESRIDFEASRAALAATDGYVVRARIERDDAAGTEIIAAIPAYNEEIAIGSTVHAARKYADAVLVVDDGSSDETAALARAAGAEVLEHPTNRGKGAAVRTLLEAASGRSCEALVLIDGDGQHLPEQIPRVAEPVLNGDADVVIGSRYLDGSADETPTYRRIGQRILDALSAGSSGQALTDTQSGFRALSPDAVERLSLTTDGIGVETEMIDSASRRGLDIEEVPIDVRYEGIDGQTYNPLYHGLAVVTFTLQLVRDRHPLVFFGAPGLALTLVGALWGIDAMLIYQSTETFYPAKVLVGGFATILGVLGIFCGLVLNRISNMMENLARAQR